MRSGDFWTFTARHLPGDEANGTGTGNRIERLAFARPQLLQQRRIWAQAAGAADLAGLLVHLRRDALAKFGNGALEVRVTEQVPDITIVDRLLLLLPVAMWVIAALMTWSLVTRLLIRPLRQLQRAVSRYTPGDSGLALPLKRITVNLAPADLAKEGSHFDLPIALAILQALGALSADDVDGRVAMGELALDGTVRPVRGVLSMAMRARSMPSVSVPAVGAVTGATLRQIAIPLDTVSREELHERTAGRSRPAGRATVVYPGSRR